MGFMTNTSLPRQHNRGGKTATIQIRVTDEEMIVLNAASERLGVSKSALLREHGLAAAMEALEEERTLAWSDEAFDALARHLEGPVHSSAEMVGMMSKQPIWARD
jgi:uncharacterized protein (DUF1778 family)